MHVNCKNTYNPYLFCVARKGTCFHVVENCLFLGGGEGYFNCTGNLIVAFDLLLLFLAFCFFAYSLLPPSSVAYRKLDLLYQVQHIPKHKNGIWSQCGQLTFLPCLSQLSVVWEEMSCSVGHDQCLLNHFSFLEAEFMLSRIASVWVQLVDCCLNCILVLFKIIFSFS